MKKNVRALYPPLTFTYGDTLVCPHCGEPSGLHICYVRTFVRPNEDSPKLTITHVQLEPPVDDHHVPSDENPSLRRSGIRLGFWCELCACVTDISMANHKGSVLVGTSYG